MKYQITGNDIALTTQNIIDLKMRIYVMQIDSEVVEEVIEGGVVSGTFNISADSDVRRTFSLNLIPEVQSDIKIAESSVIWLDKKIKVEISIKNHLTDKFNTWWPMGYYTFMNASITYDATNNQLSLSCSDLMCLLDGTKAGATPFQGIEIPAYKEILMKSWYEEAKADGEVWVENADNWFTWASKEENHPNILTKSENTRLRTYVWRLLTREDLTIETINSYIDYIESACGSKEYSITYERGLDLCTIVACYEVRSVLIEWLSVLMGANATGISSNTSDGANVKLNPLFQIGDRYEIDEIIGNKNAMPEYNDDWEQWRKDNEHYNDVPYDISLDAGSTVLSVIKSLTDLYDYYKTYFDVYGNLNVKRIPMKLNETVELSNQYIQQMLISENTSLDMSTVRNVAIVYGASQDMDGDNDFYAYSADELKDILAELQLQIEYVEKQIEKVQAELDSQTSASTGSTTDSSTSTTNKKNPTKLETLNENLQALKERVEYYKGLEDLKYTNNVYVMQVVGMDESYYNGDKIAFKPPKTNKAGCSINVNGFGDVPVYDPLKGAPIQAGKLEKGVMCVFEISRVYNTNTKDIEQKAYYLGSYQAVGLYALVGSEKNPNTNVSWYDYFKDNYNVSNVNLLILPESPYTIEKIGEYISVYTGGDYEAITSDALCSDRAEFELYKTARLTDNISLSLKICPFLDVNTLIEYAPASTNKKDKYIINTISHDFGAGTTNITCMKFYDYYPPK